MLPAPPYVCTFSGEPSGEVLGSSAGREGWHVHLRPVRTWSETQKQGWSCKSCCSLCSPPPPGISALWRAGGARRGCPSTSGRGWRRRPPSPPLTCGGRRRMRAAPGPPQAGGRPGWAKAPSRAGKACGWNFPSLPELDFAGLRRREGERGRDRSATLLAAWPGWCSLGKSEHAHWGGIKGGQPERLACLLARGAASREQRAARQPAPPPRPGGRSQ